MKSEEIPQINMGPLMDIVFILLLFFMVSTSFINERALPLNRPQSATADKLPPKTVRLYLPNNGTVILEGEVISPILLPAKLAEQQELHPGSQLLLVCDRQLPSGELVKMADIGQAAGFSQIAVATGDKP